MSVEPTPACRIEPAARLDPQALARLLGRPEPTVEQAAVVGAPPGRQVVIAGAGSGKTETMAARVVWLVASDQVRPEQVLGLTFTRKAAAELAARVRHRLARLAETRVARMIDGPTGEPTITTYHAYAGRLLAEHGMRFGLEPGTRVLGDAGLWQLADRLVHTYDGPMDQVQLAPSTVTSAVLGLSAQMSEHLVELSQLRDFAHRFAAQVEAPLPVARTRGRHHAPVVDLLRTLRARVQLLPLVEALAAAKRQAGVIDFGDQMAWAARLARDLPDVAAAERARYSMVLLDEYQDTSYAQLVLLRSLFGGPDGLPVTAVGDPCQSIYGWRGASAAGLADFPRYFAGSEPVRCDQLSVSFRNAGTILTVANTIAADLRSSEVPVPELVPPAATRDRGTVVCGLYETVVQEGQAVAARIAGVWGGPPRAHPDGATRITAAVLVRRRSQIPLLEAALRSAGVPVEVVGTGGLLSMPEVADVLATLRVLVDPAAGAALLRLLTGPRWRIGPRDLRALSRWARDLSRRADSQRPVAVGPDAPTGRGARCIDVGLTEALDRVGETGAGQFSLVGRARLVRFSAELRHLRSRVSQPVPELLDEIAAAIGIDVEAAVARGNATSGRVHLDRLHQVAVEFVGPSGSAATPVGARTGYGAVRSFLAYLDAAQERERGLAPGSLEVDDERVQILTVHAAKGLEWDVVAVPGLVSGVFPVATRGSGWVSDPAELPFPLRGDHDHLPVLDVSPCADQAEVRDALAGFTAECSERDAREERRLAYVAMTRARQVLMVTGYRWDDSQRPRQPSDFLLDVHRLAQGSERPGRAAQTSPPGFIVETWVAAPGDGQVNPVREAAGTVDWPYDPLGDRRSSVDAAAEVVRQAMRHPSPATPGTDTPGTASDLRGVGDAPLDRWHRDADLLVAEANQVGREASLPSGGAALDGCYPVRLPAELSVSDLIVLRQDPTGFTRRLRRPVPVRPTSVARTGTAFHEWVARHFGDAGLLEVDDLLGSSDDAVDDDGLVELRHAFLSTSWAGRRPIPGGIEVPFEMAVAGVLVRGRMDAVFREPDGQYLVVDWKTGPLSDPESQRAAAVQLAAYRLAWADLADVPLDRVDAAFVHVRDGRTVRPAELLDREGLEALLGTLPQE
ncbi:MAG: UvrD-helicase domain-containing protein [Actinomycetes bacterium]